MKDAGQPGKGKGSFPPAILLMGPTASGKTALALELAQHFPVSLISVDSALVFRDMDIGTAKPDQETLARFPHRLVNIISPEEAYSAARFREEALEAMAEITTMGKIPLLVGGTMLYFKALLEGLGNLPQADKATREALDAEASEKGWPALHAELKVLDPVTAARLQPTDSQRIQRALEIVRLTGQPMSTLLDQGKDGPPPYRFLSLALLPSERSILHSRIASRFREMLDNGLIDEVEMLLRRYELTPSSTSMRCVGYRQTWEYLEGEYSRRELTDRGIFATRQLAKRQITWLTNSLPGEVFDCLDTNLTANILDRTKSFLG